MEKKKKHNRIKILLGISAIVIVLLMVYVVIPAVHYNKANELLTEHKYNEAITELEKGHASESEINEAKYKNASSLIDSNPAESAQQFLNLGSYKDSEYLLGIAYYNAKDYDNALQVLTECQSKYAESYYYSAKILEEEKDYDTAINNVNEYIKNEPNGKYIDDANSMLHEIEQMKIQDQTDEILNNFDEAIFDDNLDLTVYPLLSGDSLRETLIGPWYSTDSPQKIGYVFNVGGTGKYPGTVDHQMRWDVDGDSLMLQSGANSWSSYWDYGRFRRIDLDHLLRMDSDDDNMLGVLSRYPMSSN